LGGWAKNPYIVQEVITAHGGQITVQSTVGVGTTFTLTLPLVASAATT
jgi:signal transduction histidine kinase